VLRALVATSAEIEQQRASLDCEIDVRARITAQVEAAMQGHVLAEARLVGTYQKDQ
jgi:hypothetical protein